MREDEKALREDELEIDLQKLLVAYLHKWWLLLLCAALGALIAFVFTKYAITPLYRSSVTIYVNNSRAGEQIEYISGGNLQASQQLVNTYVNIIKSDTVLSKVIEKSNLNYTIAEVREMMSTAQIDDTELFKVYVVHPDPVLSAQIANAIAAVAPKEIEGFVEGSSTKIIDYAKVPVTRYSPSFSKNTVLGGLVGGILSAIYVTILFLMDVRIKDEEDLNQLFSYPILGQIPRFDSAPQKSSSYSYGYSQHNAAHQHNRK